MAEELSFDDFKNRLQAGESQAATQLFNRFAARLIAFAQARLSARIRQKVDPEDVVQSVYRSFFRRQAAGEFDLIDWDSLWGLLVQMTVYKCSKQIKCFKRHSRDAAREVHLSPASDDSTAGYQLIDREPTPEEAALLAEKVEQLMRGFDQRQREVVTLWLQDYSQQEIVEKTGLSERTVRRLQDRVRQRAEDMQREDSGEL